MQTGRLCPACFLFTTENRDAKHAEKRKERKGLKAVIARLHSSPGNLFPELATGYEIATSAYGLLAMTRTDIEIRHSGQGKATIRIPSRKAHMDSCSCFRSNDDPGSVGCGK
jgi:hypothetical protein